MLCSNHCKQQLGSDQQSLRLGRTSRSIEGSFSLDVIVFIESIFTTNQEQLYKMFCKTLLQLLIVLQALTGLVLCQNATRRYLIRQEGLSKQVTSTVPTRLGYILFPGFELFDVWAPLSALNWLSYQHNFNLTLIADTLDPVPNGLFNPVFNVANSTFNSSFIPTHTFATAPELDILVVPGGTGTRAAAPALNSTIDFVRERYPSLKYLITICTVRSPSFSPMKY